MLLQVKNVSSSLLDGKVGRIYMPTQQISSMPQQKMKVSSLMLELFTIHLISRFNIYGSKVLLRSQHKKLSASSC